MDSATIELWIRSLGLYYHSMVKSGAIPKLPLQYLYEGDTSLEIEPVVGIEMSFWPETLRFESLHITLQEDMPGGMPIYTGELPAPFTSVMTKGQVHSILGEPLRSRGRLDLPGMINPMGGWDTYQLDSAIHPGVVVDFQYNETLQVERLSFSVIDHSG
ncbi:pyocin immunity family protein [Pseudomonas sp. MF5691]|uniref:DUF6392 family protein n=1 Tax=Pseudomonas sp. MF5691 TaxID=2797526 RepID=UPI0018E743C2|nr:DUF6392 family protein [Pseudomonas sp. MF5691]MBJ2293264.1 pyocin immunity family protein [Pseudomonas sp. MF5691]